MFVCVCVCVYVCVRVCFVLCVCVLMGGLVNLCVYNILEKDALIIQ